MIVYGTRASRIATFKLAETECQDCREMSQQDVSTFGRYVHIFWIPLFPIGKKTVSECTNCKRTLKANELTAEQKALLNKNQPGKTPIWHFLGLLIIGGFIALTLLAGVIAGATHEADPRDDLFESDIKSLAFKPSMETDSVAVKLKNIFDIFASEEIDPNDFLYRTRVTDDKALVLVKIPNLKRVEKEGRLQALEMIEMTIKDEPSFAGKEVYIGIHGKYNIMITKTPDGEIQNSRLAVNTPLLDFYGSEESFKSLE